MEEKYLDFKALGQIEKFSGWELIKLEDTEVFYNLETNRLQLIKAKSINGIIPILNYTEDRLYQISIDDFVLLVEYFEDGVCYIKTNSKAAVLFAKRIAFED